MKQNQIEELKKLNVENMENIFNVYQEQDGMYFYTLVGYPFGKQHSRSNKAFG